MEKPPITQLSVVCDTADSRRILLSELFKLRTYVWHRGDEDITDVDIVDSRYPHSTWPVTGINRHKLGLNGNASCLGYHMRWPDDHERIMEWIAAPFSECGRFGSWPIIVAREGIKVGCTVLSDEAFNDLQKVVGEFSSDMPPPDSRVIRVHDHHLRIDKYGIHRASVLSGGTGMTFDAFDDLVKALENARDPDFNPRKEATGV